VLAIKNVKTAGQLFHVTGGCHLNSDDFFCARALTERDQNIKDMEQRKKATEKAVALENTVNALLTLKGNLTPETARIFTVPECKLLLKLKNVKPGSTRKEDLASAYFNHPSPPNVDPWSPEDEMMLVALRSDDINMRDTVLGTATVEMACAVQKNLANLDPETRAELKRALACDDDGLPTGVL
jgi:hypothetical protein